MKKQLLPKKHTKKYTHSQKYLGFANLGSTNLTYVKPKKVKKIEKIKLILGNQNEIILRNGLNQIIDYINKK